jgi:hypothetical protein
MCKLFICTTLFNQIPCKNVLAKSYFFGGCVLRRGLSPRPARTYSTLADGLAGLAAFTFAAIAGTGSVLCFWHVEFVQTPQQRGGPVRPF